MAKKLSLISWNVNGIRAAERKGFVEWLEKGKYDIVAVQETKVSNLTQISSNLMSPKGFKSFWDLSTEKKGYSGVATYTKVEPKESTINFGNSILTPEGRLLQLEFDDFIFINGYFPNGGSGPLRLQYKLDFYDAFLKHLKKLKKKNPNIIFCGDVNTAHQEIDLARPKPNEKVSGFLPEERAWLDRFEEAGFVDTFRHFHPNKVQYSWWDMKSRARDRNVGWRIDYFYASQEMLKRVKSSTILDHVLGSDHAPVKLEIEI